MRKKPPEIIDVTDYRVIDDGGREPIVKSWGGLIGFVLSLAVAIGLKTAHFMGLW